MFRPLDLLHQRVPLTQIRLTSLHVKLTNDQFVQPLFSENDRHFVDRLDIFRRDDGIFIHVTKHRDLALEFRRQISVGSTQQDIGLDADLAKFIHGMLRRLGLQLTGRADVGH